MRSFEHYLFRAHAVGKLMTGTKVGLSEKQEELFQTYRARFQGEGRPLTEKQETTFHELGARRNEAPTLSATAKKYLDEIHQHEFFGRTNHLQAKYLDKGIQVEHLAVSLYSEVTGKPIFKNKEHKRNGYVKGTADNAFKKIRDIKSSWGLDTFPLYESEITNSIYEWQLQAYMDLWNFDEAELIYCLVDTPFKLIEDELRRLSWKTDLLTINGDVREDCIPMVVEVVQNHIFTSEGLKDFCHQSSIVEHDWFLDFYEIPAQMRVKIFKTERDAQKIEALYAQIENARKYLTGLSESMEKAANVLVS